MTTMQQHPLALALQASPFQSMNRLPECQAPLSCTRRPLAAHLLAPSLRIEHYMRTTTIGAHPTCPAHETDTT